MTWLRKSFAGGAVATTLNGGISSSTLSITVASGSSFPDGSGGKFVLSIDRAGSEEKILVTSRSGNVLTVSSRGYDGTANVLHADGVTIEHVLDANTIDQVNAHAAAAATRGSISFRGAGDTFTELLVGAAGVPIIGSATDPSYGQVKAAGIEADAVITSKILDANVTGPKIADATVTNAKIASEAYSAWTPVVIQGATPGLTIARGKFFKSSRRVTGDCFLTLTSGGTSSNAVTISPPVAPATATVGTVMGRGTWLRASNDLTGAFDLVYASATTMKLEQARGAIGTGRIYLGLTNSDITAALATGDIFTCFIDYEAAS